MFCNTVTKKKKKKIEAAADDLRLHHVSRRRRSAIITFNFADIVAIILLQAFQKKAGLSLKILSCNTCTRQ